MRRLHREDMPRDKAERALISYLPLTLRPWECNVKPSQKFKCLGVEGMPQHAEPLSTSWKTHWIEASVSTHCGE